MAKARVRVRNNRSKTVPNDDGEFVFLKLRRDEYKLLKARMREVATETARTLKRIEKNRKERERLRTETRKHLERLRAT